MIFNQNLVDEQRDIHRLHELVRDLSREADASEAVIICKLGECADSRAPLHLLGLLQRAAPASPTDASPKERAKHILDAFDAILRALGQYRTGHEKLQGRLWSELRKLKRARPKDWANLLRKMTANPEHSPALLSALWSAARDLGALRQCGRGQARTVEVLVDEVWVAGTVQSPWEVLLTRDFDQFPKLVKQAIASNEANDNRFDYIRRLRDLVKRPTAQKLRNFVRDAKAADQNNTDIARIGFSYAGRRTNIFPDELPADWVERVQPDQIAQLARWFLGLIKPERNGKKTERSGDLGKPKTEESQKTERGRKEDKAIAVFADKVGYALYQLTGKRITYARGTENSRVARGRSYGPGLEVMMAALQLVDSSLGSSQAQAQINRIRGWNKPTG
jgi:hypothetical protein